MGALASVHAMKGVEIGPAFENARKRGTQVHDEILREGDRLIVTVEPDGSLTVVPAKVVAQRALGMFRDVAPGRSLADELIAERRQEALREETE